MTITNETDYRNAFEEFDRLVAGMGDDAEKQAKAREVAERIQAYEQENMSFPQPTTLSGMIELRMYEMKLEPHNLAALLGINAEELTGILNGEQTVDFKLAKKLHEKLRIDGNFILEMA